MSKDLNTELKSGILWSIIEVVVKRVFDFIVKLILARLLFPEEFGIVAMATVITSFVLVLSDVGIGSALIQRAKENLQPIHFYTAFWAGIFWSILLYAIVYFIVTPVAASFYEEDLLNQVIPILSLPLLLSSINSIHQAILKRELNFKKIAFIKNTASIIAGIGAILLALADAGIWALVFNSVLPFFIMIPLFFFTTKWFPKLKWDKKAFKEIFGFGIFTLGTALIVNISANIDYLIIGKVIGATALGAYTLAYMLTNLVKSQITSMLNRVMFPFYSKIQHDIEEIKEYYFKVVKYYSILIYPIMLYLIIFGDFIVVFFFGDKWVDTIFPMKILALSVLIEVLTNGYNLLFRSIGKPKLEMAIQLITLILIFIPSVIIGAYLNGIIGVSYAILIAVILNFFIVILSLKRYLTIKFQSIIKSASPAIIALLIGFLIVFPIEYFKLIPTFISMVLLSLIIGSVYYKLLKVEVNYLKNKFLKK